MANPFKVGDQVIFYQDTLTSATYGIAEEMKHYFWNKVVLTITRADIKTVVCMGPKDVRGWNFHYKDLKLVDDRTEDEIYLGNLLKGANN